MSFNRMVKLYEETRVFDIPFTVDNQIRMFKQAGFASADMVYRMENSTVIIAKK